jgi:hypothetical protein
MFPCNVFITSGTSRHVLVHYLSETAARRNKMSLVIFKNFYTQNQNYDLMYRCAKNSCRLKNAAEVDLMCSCVYKTCLKSVFD